MFQKIQYRLLLSYLLVFASILVIFAVAVRVVFTHSLTEKLIEKLKALGQGAASYAEFENNRMQIDKDLFSAIKLIDNEQSLQWFDTHGRLIFQQGRVVNLPFSIKDSVQFQTGKIRIIAVILPIIGSDNRQMIGYVRASQTLDELDETLYKLDWGLCGAIVMALGLSGIGGVWLTRQAMQPIEESFQRLKQFTADASHELRSPLMAIKSNAAVALKYPEGMRPKDAEKFQAIALSTNQMTRLTEDLLLLARTDIQAREWKHTNLTLIIQNLMQLYKPQAELKKIKFKYQAISDLYLLGDSVQLTRLFTNLIENAIYYTPSGGVVEINSNRIGSHLVVNVQDTGMGIAPEDIKYLFERFWRADQSRSYWAGGSGLGLAIAQAIAQNHGGLITVTSQLGVGSCFTVHLSAS